LTFIFYVCDRHTCTIDSVDRPCPETNSLHFIREIVQGALLCLFPKSITQIVDYLFEILNLLVPFPHWWFLVS